MCFGFLGLGFRVVGFKFEQFREFEFLSLFQALGLLGLGFEGFGFKFERFGFKFERFGFEV